MKRSEAIDQLQRWMPSTRIRVLQERTAWQMSCWVSRVKADEPVPARYRRALVRAASGVYVFAYSSPLWRETLPSGRKAVRSTGGGGTVVWEKASGLCRAERDQPIPVDKVTFISHRPHGASSTHMRVEIEFTCKLSCKESSARQPIAGFKRCKRRFRRNSGRIVTPEGRPDATSSGGHG